MKIQKYMPVASCIFVLSKTSVKAMRAPLFVLIIISLQFSDGCLSNALDPSRDETKFKKQFPVGMPRDAARRALSSRRLDFDEKLNPAADFVQMSPGEQREAVKPGERVISIRSTMHMGCWEMNPILIFDDGDRLRKVAFSGWPNCP